MDSSNYNKYMNSLFSITFEYPKEWNLTVESFKSDPKSKINPLGLGGAIIISGPRETVCGEGKSVIFINKIPSKPIGGYYEYVEEYANEFITIKSFRKPKIIFQKEQKLGDLLGMEVSIIYERPCPFDSPRSKSLKMQHTWLTVLSKNYFFELNYVTSEHDYPLYYIVYEHVKETFRFV